MLGCWAIQASVMVVWVRKRRAISILSGSPFRRFFNSSNSQPRCRSSSDRMRWAFLAAVPCHSGPPFAQFVVDA